MAIVLPKKNRKKGAGNPPGTNYGGGHTPLDPFTDYPENMAKLEALAGYGLTTDQIAPIFKISRTTFFELMDRRPAVREAWETGKSKGLSMVAQTLHKRAVDGDMTAAIFYLKTQGGWRDKSEIVISGGITHEIELQAVKRIESMTEDQRQSRLRELLALKEVDDAVDVEFDEVP